MAKGIDTRERILDKTVELLRRHGPAKVTVVDVARALEMSHANVYRHFASKAALTDAVAERWLETVSRPLDAIAAGDDPAPERLGRWLFALIEIKRRKVLEDPELFSTYHAIAVQARDVVSRHVDSLRGQVERIVRDGVAAGAFRVADPGAAASAVLDATLRFHHPHHVLESAGRPVKKEARRVLGLLLAGLAAGVV